MKRQCQAPEANECPVDASVTCTGCKYNKRFTLQDVRNLKYRKNGDNGFMCEVADDLTAYIEPNRNPTGEKVRGSYSSRVNGKKTGAGDYNDCVVFNGFHLLDLEAIEKE